MRWFLLTILLLALILVPFFIWEDWFNTLGDRIARGELSTWYAAAAIAALLASDIVLPIPSSIVSAAAGVLLGFWKGTLTVWIGMSVACLIGYWIGARATGFARRFVGPDGLARADRLAARYGDYALLVCRPVPVLAEASTIFAGVVHTPFRRYLHLTTWSNLGIAAGYSAVGAFSMRVDSFLLAFLGAIALPGVAMLAARVFKFYEQKPARRT